MCLHVDRVGEAPGNYIRRTAFTTEAFSFAASKNCRISPLWHVNIAWVACFKFAIRCQEKYVFSTEMKTGVRRCTSSESFFWGAYRS